MITRQKIDQSGKTTTIKIAISFFRLPFGDKNMKKDKSTSSLVIILYILWIFSLKNMLRLLIKIKRLGLSGYNWHLSDALPFDCVTFTNPPRHGSISLGSPRALRQLDLVLDFWESWTRKHKRGGRSMALPATPSKHLLRKNSSPCKL